MKLALVTTVWNRMDITIPVLEYYADLQIEDLFINRIAVCSSQKEGERIQSIPKWDVTYYMNEPLSEKHNRGVVYARTMRPDAVCIVNSDDLLSAPYLEKAAEEIEDGTGVVRLLSSVMVNTLTGEAAWTPSSLPMSGVVMSSDVLDELNWRPWNGPGINEYLDNRLGENLESVGPSAVGYQPSPTSEPQLCSLKSDQQIWSYDEHLEVCEDHSSVEAGSYLWYHFPFATDLLPNAAV